MPFPLGEQFNIHYDFMPRQEIPLFQGILLVRETPVRVETIQIDPILMEKLELLCRKLLESKEAHVNTRELKSIDVNMDGEKIQKMTVETQEGSREIKGRDLQLINSDISSEILSMMQAIHPSPVSFQVPKPKEQEVKKASYLMVVKYAFRDIPFINGEEPKNPKANQLFDLIKAFQSTEKRRKEEAKRAHAQATHHERVVQEDKVEVRESAVKQTEIKTEIDYEQILLLAGDLGWDFNEHSQETFDKQIFKFREFIMNQLE